MLKKRIIRSVCVFKRHFIDRNIYIFIIKNFKIDFKLRISKSRTNLFICDVDAHNSLHLIISYYPQNLYPSENCLNKLVFS